MSPLTLRSDSEEPPSERRTQILDAAERRFARAGFHRTTMQDVAAEAGMSPGNLYRYFSSKDALVAGMCERDRVRLADEFRALHGRPDFMEAFRELGRRNFEDSARDRARLCLEIWAEAARNPVIAALQTDFDRSMTEWFVDAFDAARREGAVAAAVDSRAAASIIMKLGDGLFVRRATATDFDAEREMGEVFAVIGAILGGAVALPAAPSDAGSRH